MTHLARLSLVLLSLAAASAATADQIIHTFSLTRENYFKTNHFDAFDPRLGALDAVTFTCDLQSRGGVSLLNQGPDAEGQYLNVGYGVFALVYRKSGNGFPGQNVAYASVGRDSGVEGSLATGESFYQSFDFSGAQESDVVYGDPPTPGDDDTETDEPSGVFTGDELKRFYARYAGDQTYVESALLNYVQMSALPKSIYTYDLDFVLRTNVTYSYTPAPVPEPSALAALGVGAVAFLRRRRRA